MVWSKHNQNPGERRSTHRARQGRVMGKLIKSSQRTPADIVAVKHKDDEKYIRKRMAKWHDRTQGTLQWPTEGTFAEKQCEDVREMMRHWKVGKNDYKTRGKRVKKLAVLSWFEEEGKELRKREEALKKVRQDERVWKRK